MKSEITEEFISGFCKAQNQTRMVVCELEKLEDGSIKLLSSDCAYGKCEHSKDCLLMGQIK
ncbi:MAG: ubiquinone biosynthesis protein UbiE [Lachnospiraceae bacterium]|nr:ubiquinone biosynthesis protein UbiE [Lachnospiraceae bacterium]MDD7076668.1 ubiquinone biosynthesis protein UbiE [Lachnospiraceae bacterium]MDY3730836.1 ubiquinone biosynthesis protein UbiE [Candidatus Choladocola sp.]